MSMLSAYRFVASLVIFGAVIDLLLGVVDLLIGGRSGEAIAHFVRGGLVLGAAILAWRKYLGDDSAIDFGGDDDDF